MIKNISIDLLIPFENHPFKKRSGIAPFKNILNEMYARDISKKIRSAHRLRGSMGEPLSQPPYGYMKSPENKKKWII